MDFRGFDMIEASNPKNSPPALGMRIVALALCAGVKFLVPKVVEMDNHKLGVSSNSN